MTAEDVCRGAPTPPLENRRENAQSHVPNSISAAVLAMVHIQVLLSGGRGAGNRQVVSRPAPGLARDWMTSPGLQKHAIHTKKRAPLACSDGTQLLETLATTQRYFCKTKPFICTFTSCLFGTSQTQSPCQLDLHEESLPTGNNNLQDDRHYDSAREEEPLLVRGVARSC